MTCSNVDPNVTLHVRYFTHTFPFEYFSFLARKVICVSKHMQSLEVKIKISSGVVSFKASFLGLQMATFLLALHTTVVVIVVMVCSSVMSLF